MRQPLRLHLRPRPWRFVVLALVCVAGLGVAALERWRQDDVYRVWAAVGLSRMLNPVMGVTKRGLNTLRQVGRMQELRHENQELARELGKVRMANQLAAEELRRLQRLSGLGRWSGPSELRFLTADVIGFVTNEESAEMIINRGSEDGVQPRDPVVALGGLVGLVLSAAPHTAHVQGLNDPLSAVGAVATETRARGVVYGRGRGKPLEFIPENEVQAMKTGMQLVTSGFENSVYPKGIVIGKITGQQANMYGMPFGAAQPMVTFESIEEVLVVLPRQRFDANTISTASLGRFTLEVPGQSPLVTSATLQNGAATSGTLNVERATTDSLLSSTPAMNTTDTMRQKALQLRKSNAPYLRDVLSRTSSGTTRVNVSVTSATPTVTPTATPQAAGRQRSRDNFPTDDGQ